MNRSSGQFEQGPAYDAPLWRRSRVHPRRRVRQVRRAAAPVLVGALRRSGITRGLVVDLGCGSGILSAQVMEQGYHALGVDISDAMIALCKQAPRGDFRVQSILSADLPRCVAVAAVGECLNYLFDPRNTRTSLLGVLAANSCLTRTAWIVHAGRRRARSRPGRRTTANARRRKRLGRARDQRRRQPPGAS